MSVEGVGKGMSEVGGAYYPLAKGVRGAEQQRCVCSGDG